MIQKHWLAVAAPMALAASLASGNAMAAASVSIVTDTELQLDIQWTGTISDFSLLALPDPVNWDLLGLYTDVTTKSIFDINTSVWEAAVLARHAVPDPGPYPHAGETRFGPVYSAYLSGSLGASASDSKMGDHNGNDMVSPANWTTPHWDHYQFSFSSNADGSGTMELVALHPVPEPAPYALLLGGLLAVGLWRHRQRAR